MSPSRSVTDVTDSVSGDNPPRCDWSAFDSDAKSVSAGSLLKSLQTLRMNMAGQGPSSDETTWSKSELEEHLLLLASRGELLVNRFVSSII